MGKSDRCGAESPAFQNTDGDHIQRSGKLSPLTKSISVPSFRVGDAFGLFTPYLNDVFLAAQILRGYYQPAGPLISSHLVGPQNLTKPPISLLDPDPRIQQPQQSTSSAEPPDGEILIAGEDELQRPQHTFRYPPQQQQPALPLPIPVPGPYARNMHQMHCPTYPPTYYGPYSQHPQEMCYSPAYQSPYYPQKVYPGPYRRYLPSSPGFYPPPPTSMYESVQTPPSGHMQPSPTPHPPPPNAQLVAGPSGPQHIDHYSPYCAGYSPGGGQCYTRGMQPPYMDSSPYPPNCPCPMQSCPKNVHTGPLIGSKTSKGPGQTINHQVASHNDRDTNTPSLKVPSVSTDATSCKAPDSSHIFVKPEFVDDHRMETLQPNTVPASGATSTCTGIFHSEKKDHDKVGFAPHYYPNYSLNSKILEPPEQSISPARGSTGLPVSPSLQPSASESPGHPVQTSTASTLPYPSVIGRRARVGKSMAREMMMQSHLAMPLKHDGSQMQSSLNTGSTNASDGGGQTFLTCPVGIPTTLIKEEDMKKEREDTEIEIEIEKPLCPHPDDFVQEYCSKTPPTSPNNVDPIAHTVTGTKKRKNSENNCEIINLEENTLEVVSPNLKRKKMQEIRLNTSKLSQKCGYKSLIRPSQPKPYLCKASRKKTHSKAPYRLGNKKNQLISNGKKWIQSGITKKPKMKRKAVRRLSLLDQRIPPTTEKDLENDEAEPTLTDVDVPAHSDQFPKLLDSSSDKNAKEYFSENEIVTRKQEQIKSQKKSSSTRSKSESKKVASTEDASKKVKNAKNPSKNPKKVLPANGKNQTSSSKSATKPTAPKQKLPSKSIDAHKSATSSEEVTTKIPIDTLEAKPRSKSNNKSKAISSSKNNNNIKLHNETINHNNNNNSFLFDKNGNNNKNNDNNAIDAGVLLASTETMIKLPPLKRSKSRGGTKFSNKKRHRARCIQEIPVTILPRRTMTSPRWSNGWSWEGEPFQGKVFLNSDEHQAFRTRYPAMKHVSGDIIRPGDCVLLRAGSKKNELPYVAKVASLWENPEDGEMMMSLFWYYRPEHTEQGRQETDCSDEVFASKHLDHNSVACIEDKCYVLTFNEYCRYRKIIKAIEEGVELVPSIVPLLNQQIDREIPLNTNSELILFCRRVYDFRLKRLIKNPS